MRLGTWRHMEGEGVRQSNKLEEGRQSELYKIICEVYK